MFKSVRPFLISIPFLSVAFAISGQLAFADFKVGLVLDRGGKDDKSFNSSAFKGAMEAKDKLHVFVKYVEATDDNTFEPMLRAFAEKDFDLIIGIGFSQAEAMKKVSAKFPQKHFAIVDSEVDNPNVRSLLFQEHEGSYLVGAIAALTSKTNSVGFVGGMDIPLIRRFEKGYIAGAKSISPNVKVISNFVGTTGGAWNDPTKAKELAISQINSRVDIIFAAAGASGNGVFDAVEEKKKLAIGCDSNQDDLKPGFILTSMLKRVDRAVYDAIADSKNGKFSGGVKRFGLSNTGIDFSVDSSNSKILTADVIKKVNAIKAQIVAGKINVPDYYKDIAKK